VRFDPYEDKEKKNVALSLVSLSSTFIRTLLQPLDSVFIFFAFTEMKNILVKTDKKKKKKKKKKTTAIGGQVCP